MKTIYFDTNIFLYLCDSSSSFHTISVRTVDLCAKEELSIVTSCETIQEVVHYSINTKQIENGLSSCDYIMQLIDTLLPVDESTIRTYLSLVKRYRSVMKSRDLIHLATCITNGLHTIVSVDKEMKHAAEVSVITPDEFVKLHTE